MHAHHTALLVVSGPSGSGKSTLLKRLLATHAESFGFSVSHTTRSPRPGEADGREYHFVTPAAFGELAESRAFVEWARFSANMYGTSFVAVEAVQATGRTCVLDIDLQGVQSVKKAGLEARFVFVQPPTLEELETRLRARNTENEESLQLRLEAARRDMQHAATPGVYDKVIVNDDLERAYSEFSAYALSSP